MIPGDHVSHYISPDRDVATETSYQSVKDNMIATNDLVKKHFGDSLVITVLGNNDSEYHNQAPDEDAK